MEKENTLEKKESAKKANPWLWAIGAIVVAVVVGAYLLLKDKPVAEEAEPIKNEIVEESVEVQPDADIQNIKEFNLSAKSFEFSQKEIRVKKGDVVKINLIVEKGVHDWVLDEFSVKTKQLTVGQTDFVEFIANKVGVFEYYCSVANHRQMGMVGKIIIEE